MSIHKTGKGRFEVRWREGSRNRSRTFDRKEDAKDWQDHVRRQSQLGEVVPTRTGSITLEVFFAQWLATRHNLSKRTRALYIGLFETHILDDLGYVPLSALTPERIQEWQSKRLNAGAGRGTIAKAATLLNQLLRRAVEQRKLTHNPVVGLEKPRPEPQDIIPATPKQIEAIRAWFIDRERYGDAVLVSLLAYGGLRMGEALGLKWEDLGKGERLWIARSLEDDGTFKATKNRVQRLVQLPEPAAHDLLSWRRAVGAEGLVFPRPKDGSGWTKTDRNNWRRRWFGLAAKAAGWPYPPKNLRNSCASLLIVAGKRPTEVAEYLGHSLEISIRNYQRYMREMEGQPTRPLDDLIWEARSAVKTEKIEAENDPATVEASGVRAKEIALD